MLINDEIAIAAVPGESFAQLQLDWKQKVNVPQPFVFGYIRVSLGPRAGDAHQRRQTPARLNGELVTSN